MNVIIIEDEPLASENLLEFIERYDQNIRVLEVLRSIKDTLAWLRANQSPDLIFSDIELLDGNIFDVFQGQKMICPVIFTTAYDQFWMQAFERNGIAYLLKPITFEKFAAAMQKFETLKRNFVSARKKFWREIQADYVEPKYKERFVVKVKGGIRLLETNQISYIKMQNELPFAFDATGNKFMLNNSLTRLEELLDPKIFFRLNRSEIINLNFIENLKPDFQDRLVVTVQNSNVRLVSSASRTPKLRKWLEGQ